MPIRSSSIQQTSAQSYTVNWPAGTQVGDVVFIFAAQESTSPSTPSGWYSHYAASLSTWNGSVIHKVMTSADITAGGVTIGPWGSAAPGVAAAVATQGYPAPMIGSNAYGGPSLGNLVSINSANISGSPVLSFPLQQVDTVLYFGSALSTGVASVGRGTSLQVSSGTVCGCLYSETGPSGTVAPTFSYSVPPAGNGDFQFMLAILNPGFCPQNMSANNVPTPLVASASTAFNPAFFAFVGLGSESGSGFGVWVGTNSGTDWLEIDLGSGNQHALTSYSFGVYGSADQWPTAWTMQGSNDGSTWTTLDTESGVSWSSSLFFQNFPASGGAAYRYFRINITATTGGAYTQVGQVLLYGTSAGSPNRPIIFVAT